MNKSDAGREYSDADSSVVEFPTGKSRVAVNSALIPAVALVSLLIAHIMSQGGNRQEKLQAAFLLVRCSQFAKERMLGAGMKTAGGIFGR